MICKPIVSVLAIYSSGKLPTVCLARSLDKMWLECYHKILIGLTFWNLQDSKKYFSDYMTVAVILSASIYFLVDLKNT